MFEGSWVAIVTPFHRGKVDEKRLRQLVEFHATHGTDGIVPCGTTGESATLTHEEHDRVIELVIEASAGRLQVLAGTGSNNTAEAIRLTKRAKQAGADGALLISPYYNKPTQEGLYRHFRAVAESVDLPLVLYNIASRTAVNIEPETFGRLVRDVPTIIGVKESSGNLEQMSRIMALAGPRLTLLSGDDGLTLPVLAIGGKGVISVVANIVPELVSQLVRSFNEGHVAEAQELHARLLLLVKALFIETNPIPVKTAMGMLGMLDLELRLPLCEMSPANREKLQQALQEFGLTGGASAAPSARGRTGRQAVGTR